MESTNSSKWWRQIKSLTGQDIQQEWYHQFLGDAVNTKLLANEINDFFVSLTDHFTPLTCDSLPSLVPQELFVSNKEVFRSLSSLIVAKAVGPENIPNKLLKDFAHKLAPVIRNIYNQSLKEGYIPSLLKSSIITPIPKVNPPREMKSDLFIQWNMNEIFVISLSEMQIGDNKVSWWVEYKKPLLLHVPDCSSTLASMIVPLPFGS